MSMRRQDHMMSQNSRLRMDRQPAVARITDPSLPAGKRKEIDNLMKKARASTGAYWDKKLLEVEEKDPNRWRHSGYKKLYIEGETSSSCEEMDPRAYNSRPRVSRSHSRGRRSPPRSPEVRRRTPRSPEMRMKRPKSPAEPPLRRRSPRSPRSPPRSPHVRDVRRRTPPSSHMSGNKTRTAPPPVSRSKRPPSPPPRRSRSASGSSVSSCSDESCSVCSPKNRHGHARSRSVSLSRSRPAPRSPPPMVSKSGGRPIPHGGGGKAKAHSGGASSSTSGYGSRMEVSSSRHTRPVVSSPVASAKRPVNKPPRTTTRHIPLEAIIEPEPSGKHGKRSARKQMIPEDPRLKARPPEPPQPVAVEAQAPTHSKRHKDKSTDKLRAKVKIEGEKRKRRRSSSSGSDDSSSSSASLPAFTATTRLTLSERFGKMAQWSVDRSNMENMRITKDSAGGALKVMIQEGMESDRRRNYSPAPPGHFPEELAATAPTGLLSWDDVRVRYEYYKSRGYLRDLDLQDYIKWEEWWYRYQEWLKQERYYEFLERQQMRGRRRKKLPIAQRLN
ncbi:serine/arginine repetitive matrix protein 1 [Sergentomyia squamirostris]